MKKIRVQGQDGFFGTKHVNDDSKVEPIAITEEWLTRLGFARSPYNSINWMLGTQYSKGDFRYIFYVNGSIEAFYKDKSIYPSTTVQLLKNSFMDA